MASLRRLLWTLCFLPSIIASSTPVERRETAVQYELEVPNSPDDHRQIIDASFQSLSIEFFAFMEYSGNSTYSNPLNTNLINNIRLWGGVPIKVRIGGSSQGSVWWLPDQEEGLIGYYKSDEDKTYNVTLGPAFFDAFDAWPEDTEFVLGLPYPWEEESFLASNIEIGSRAYEKLGARLIGLELGNERNSLDITPPEFTYHFLEDAYSISKAIFGEETERIYTIGTFTAPTLVDCDDPDDSSSCWSVRSLFENGINKKGIAAWADTHQYMLLFDTEDVTRQYLMNHNNTAYFVDSHQDLAAYTTELGVPYILGETNSLFGHGLEGVSDTFAAALWNIDYTLYSAQTNITRLGFHQCFGWKYSAWRPIDAFGYSSGILPSFYSFWIVQKALGANGSEKQVEALITDDQFAVYGIYELDGQELMSLIAVNLLDWEDSSGEDDRPEVTVDLNNVPTSNVEAKVYRLSAAGANIAAAEDITFAGQYLDGSDGSVQGEIEYEALGEGEMFTLKASEAVLITFF